MPDVLKEFVPVGRPNRNRRPLHVEFVTVHNTSNAGKGADAKAHSRFVRETGYYLLNGAKNWVSWHFTVDDKMAIQQLPLNERGIHAGAGNGRSLGVEICMHQGIDQAAADRRAALLIGSLLRELGLPADAVRTHKAWTGKGCPKLLLSGDRWGTFLAAVEEAWSPAFAPGEAPPVDPEEIARAKEPAPAEAPDPDALPEGELDDEEPLTLPADALSPG